MYTASLLLICLCYFAWRINERHQEEKARQKQINLNLALIAAVRQQDVRKVETLLAQGADANARDDVNYRPLPWALNAASPQPYVGPTALMIAADEGALQITRRLLDHGADVNAPGGAAGSMNANTCPTSVADLTPTAFPLMEAVWGGNPAIVRLLLHRGASVNERDTLGHTALMYAPQAGLDSPRRTRSDISIYGTWQHLTRQTTLILLNNGASINAKDDEGKTVLMRAVALRGVGPIEFFIDHGANINAKDKNGDSVLSFSLRTDVYRLLVKRGVR